MTSLQETLPILDQAVPALPGKVQAVAREAESFDKAARAAIAGFHDRRSAAEGLIDEVRRSLEALRDQAADEREAVDASARALRDAAEAEAQGIDEGADWLALAGDRARTALEMLESQLDEAADRTRAAQQEGEAALDALDEGTHGGRADLEQAAQQLTAAAGGAQEAITAGQAMVAEGVDALAAHMAGALARVQARLERTLARMDDLHGEQEDEVADTLAGLVARRQQVGQELGADLEEAVSDRLQPELDALVSTWGALGAQVGQLEADCQSQREELDPQLGAAGDRVEPLQDAIVQVKQAAERVGLSWP
ncbi:MAG TPA: hypothetical protein VFQ51_13440 [Vicinamibacteria bacterium]|nr:hypothetical protein [Vicinamibacteria bacterium]